ncbi:MAG TPA: hypothetical protein VK163_09485 [Opitutaceae bacterium]|nr:hypothetical protein [Opitutaceae bacterium]
MKQHLFLCLLLFLLVPARAERDESADRHRRPETGRVVLYSAENFEGVAVELLPGAVVPNLGDLRFSDGRPVQDRISSVRVFGPIKITVYSDADFRGEALEIDRDLARLNRVPRRPGANWDNCMSSVRVSGGRDDDRGHWDRNPGRDGSRRHERWSGAEIERLVTRAYRELLQREPNGAELRRYREAVQNEDWGRDEIYDDIRASREYRSQEAERIVVRVYRELLGRDPDPSGREHWRRKILEKGWSEERFRDVIRDTDEYRQRQHSRRDAH